MGGFVTKKRTVGRCEKLHGMGGFATGTGKTYGKGWRREGW